MQVSDLAIQLLVGPYAKFAVVRRSLRVVCRGFQLLFCVHRQPFEDAKLPVQTKYELVDGTQGIIHEGGDDTKEFEVEFEPKSKRQSMHWVDMIESVIQRQSKVLTSSFVFNFEPKALPQAAAPPSGWPELVSHSLIGVDFRSDDHGRGAILAAYSPSRQLEFFGIPLQSALLRVNSLEVAHLTHSRAMEMIDIAVRRARPRRHESSRTITLEFCSPDDYYQYVPLLLGEPVLKHLFLYYKTCTK